MKVDRKMLHQTAHLARLNIKPTEEDKLLADMDKILAWVEKLKEIDTSTVEPLVHVTDEFNVLRNDNAQYTITARDALKNAPAKDDRYFKVPKVLK